MAYEKCAYCDKSFGPGPDAPTDRHWERGHWFCNSLEGRLYIWDGPLTDAKKKENEAAIAAQRAADEETRRKAEERERRVREAELALRQAGNG